MSQRQLGAILAYAQILLNICIALGFTPVLVKALGSSGYGLYIIVGSFVAYLVILDLGMNDAVIRHLLRFWSAGDNEAASRFLGSMLSTYSLVGVGVVVVASGFFFAVPHIFSAKVSPQELDLLKVMFAIAAGTTAFTVAFNPVGALISARERFVFLRLLEMAVTVASTLIVLILLRRGMGALMAVAVSYGALLTAVLIKFLYAQFVLKEKIRYAWFSRDAIAPVLRYAAPIFVAMLVEQIYWRLDNILIGAFLGTSAVAMYAIGVMFNKYFMSFATAISRVMVPELIRRVDAGAHASELTELLVRVARTQATVLMLILTGLVIFGDEFIVLWLGPEYSHSYYVMLLALCPYALELMGNLRNILLQVKGLYWYRVSVFAAMALINIPLTIVLLNVYGVVGAAAATGICILLGHFLILLILQRQTGVRMLDYYEGLCRGLALAIAACFLLGWLLDSVLPGGWSGLIAKGSAYTILYMAVLWQYGMQPGERESLRAVAFAFRKKLDGR
ncbi:oligosaccharide flippase family protein [Ramlibacter sp. USB13]|uniref:Oligosaccharide flippase family protein n=1 Tax=Ramlibacter cellulosilyticus TaxID=2764187 RepID=A0A923MTB7_9BURK|nr:oligosaccharide flippase family protein [Ramlibacter cellulosilyticus]MBC5784868.1 oligosaccharide flippase family protein [Ramlibacter cellulosilyticus]